MERHFFYLKEKKNCVNEVQEPIPDRGRVSKEEKKNFFHTTFMNSLFFMSCSGLKFSHSCQLTIVAMWQKEAERGWFSISIVNNKLEWVPQFHAMSSHTDASLWETNLNFEFQHDSRLYEGICVHVCIYLFMCNLTGTVNMVHLLRLLFYLSGASCFSGFEYSLSSLCGFTVLRKQKGFFLFQFSPLVACWGVTEASEQI